MFICECGGMFLVIAIEALQITYQKVKGWFMGLLALLNFSM